jgi:NADPH:quinone reductase-like Zn-dependent oxidoreductase
MKIAMSGRRASLWKKGKMAKEKAEAETAAMEEVAVHDSMAAMIAQASALAEEEAVGGTEATLGDMEVTLRAIKKPSPISSPSQRTQRILSSQRSPTSQFEYDVMEATHRTLDFDILHKSRSFALIDDDNESISSEESLQEEKNDEESVLTDALSTGKKAGDNDELADEPVKMRNDELSVVTDAPSTAKKAGGNYELADEPVKIRNDDESVLTDGLSTAKKAGSNDELADEPVKIRNDDESVLTDGLSTAKKAGSNDELVDEPVKIRNDEESVVTDGLSTAKKAGDNDELADEPVKIRNDELSVVTDALSTAKKAGCNDELADEPEKIRNDEESVVTDGLSTASKAEDNDELVKLVKIRNDEESVVTDGLSTASKAEDSDELDEMFDEMVEDFVEQVFAPTNTFADFMLCHLQCAFPNTCNEVNESLSNNLHNVFEGDGEEDKAAAKLENASYSPGVGIMRKVGRFPKLSEDKVLIRVDATSISTRDCLERLRRYANKELKNSVWVPGHEIVGRVVRAGTNAEVLLDKRIAALLPYGGGCSQYVCIDAKHAIALPEEADIDSNKVVALLSTYMTAYQCLESFLCIESKEEEDAESEAEEIDRSYAGQKKSVLFGEKKPLSGKNVLVVGAGSPVGLAFVDLAKTAGATVCTLSHRIHLNAIRGIGANFWYDLSQKTSWEANFAGKMDLIVDTVGDSGNDPSFYKVMRIGGRCVKVNTSSCGQKYVPRRPQEQGFKLLDGYTGRVINYNAINYDVFHSFNDDKELFAEDLACLQDLLRNGKIRPKIFSRVGLNEVEGEFDKVMAGETNGGVVVVLPKMM